VPNYKELLPNPA